MRYLNDVVLTWKASDKLTLTTEADLDPRRLRRFFATGKPGPTNGYGAAQYASTR